MIVNSTISNLIVSVFILSPLCEKFRDNKKESSRDIITLIDSLPTSAMIISQRERIALGKVRTKTAVYKVM